MESACHTLRSTVTYSYKIAARPSLYSVDDFTEELLAMHESNLNLPGRAQARVTVWYDSGCPLCAREIQVMRRLDRKGAVNFVDIERAADCPVGRSALMERFHAREAGKPVVSGAAAFAAMWRAIPLLRPFGLLAKWPPVLWLLERMYRGFLRFRPALQRRARRMLKA